MHLVHLDDTYEGWTGLPGVAPRLVADLLTPLNLGNVGGYRRYDWHTERFAGWSVVAPGELLIIEGVGAGHRDLDPFSTLLVWVEAPAELCLERGLARDGEAMRPQWLAWREAEVAYFAAQALPDRADVVLSGR